MTVQAVLLSYGAHVGRFDNFKSGLFAIFGNERLIGQYFGPLYQVRRSVSGTLTGSAVDIYPDSTGLLDTAAVLAVAAGNEVMVLRAYDQSGNGNHFDAPSGDEPRLCSGGAMDYNLLINPASGHTADKLICINNAGSTAAKTMFLAGDDIGGNYGVIAQYGDASRIGAVSGWQQAIQWYNTAGVSHWYIGNDANAGYAQFDSSGGGYSAGNVGMIFVPAAGTPISGFKNGTSIVGSSSTSGAGGGTGNFSAHKWGVGTRTIDDLSPSRFAVAFFACYETDKSADAAAISALTYTHF